jgi:hypothetical protein
MVDVCISGVGEWNAGCVSSFWVLGGGCFLLFGLILKCCCDGNNGTIIEITLGGVVIVWYVVWAVV